MVDLDGLAVVREARILAVRGNQAGGITPGFAHSIHAPGMYDRAGLSQFAGLRLLLPLSRGQACGAPRNDIRRRGLAAPVPPGREGNCAEQSQSVLGGIDGKACQKKRLGEIGAS
jgi:hypothetical protein